MMKKIIIVGGSKGIGNAIIKSLLPSNFVVNLSRTTPEITHDNLEHHKIDILNDELPYIEDADVLIYCPGSINLKPISRLTLDNFRSDFDINVIGAVRSIQKYLPVLKNSKYPSILLFSTVATELGMPFHASVAASKSAVEGLGKSLAAELAPSIRVNIIAPTVTNTTLAANLLRNEKAIQNMQERHPLKMILEPEDVAEMVKFLTSNGAAGITGQIFKLDCGIVSLKS